MNIKLNNHDKTKYDGKYVKEHEGVWVNTDGKICMSDGADGFALIINNKFYFYSRDHANAFFDSERTYTPYNGEVTLSN